MKYSQVSEQARERRQDDKTRRTVILLSVMIAICFLILAAEITDII